ncbi:hypothetical protein WM42_2008 [Corynebacterium simulans]|uniref:hypothetical protein n=1 Tax=Corynebacterium simulans TaxID=146827 RepID=UPI0007866927|nr:hypothetical protein [Corynebacterium simulans]AMO89710.1 hypothetical protein WM42_2008 [Corynebacterium simulans]
MPNPARQEILDAQLARQWAEWNKSCEVSSPEIQAAANFILANTTPPTMAEVEWDDDKHFLAEAENALGMRFLMVCKHDSFNIRCLGSSTLQGRIIGAEFLTPTGKRYTLTEVQE